MKKEKPLRYLLLFITTLLLFQSLAYSSDRTIGEGQYEELNLINPSETLKNAKVRLNFRWSIVIFHSNGVLNVKPERLPESVLKELNYDEKKHIEYEKESIEYWKKQRTIDEEKGKLEKEKRKLEKESRIAEEKEEKIRLELERKHLEESIHAQFDEKLGLHTALVELVISSLHDPESFRHLGTKYEIEESFSGETEGIEVRMQYSGTNLYGGRVAKTAIGSFTLEGKPIGKWYNFEDRKKETLEQIKRELQMRR